MSRLLTCRSLSIHAQAVDLWMNSRGTTGKQAQATAADRQRLGTRGVYLQEYGYEKIAGTGGRFGGGPDAHRHRGGAGQKRLRQGRLRRARAARRQGRAEGPEAYR